MTTEETDLSLGFFFLFYFPVTKAFLHRAARNGCTKIWLAATGSALPMELIPRYHVRQGHVHANCSINPRLRQELGHARGP